MTIAPGTRLGPFQVADLLGAGGMGAVYRQITDFGDGPIFIVRRVSWSSDGSSIVAAVGEADADVVFLEVKGGRWEGGCPPSRLRRYGAAGRSALQGGRP